MGSCGRISLDGVCACLDSGKELSVFFLYEDEDEEAWAGRYLFSFTVGCGGVEVVGCKLYR